MVYLLEYGFLCNVYIKVRVESCQGCRAKSIFSTQHWCSESKMLPVHEIDSDEDNDNEELEKIDLFLEKEVIYKVYCKGQ